MKRNKAQIAIEYLFYIGVLLLFLVIFSNHLSLKQKVHVERKSYDNIKQTLIYLKKSLDYVYNAGKGIHYNITLPEELNNKPYNISVINHMIILDTEEGTFYSNVLTPYVNGSLERGKVNELSYKDGAVYVERTSV